MSIAAANLFTRNVHRDWFNPALSGAAEATSAKRVSIVIKVGALAFILFLPLQYAIQLQLLGGIWIIQTLPAIVIGLFTRWFHGRALFIGWAVGMATGTAMAAAQHFTSSIYPLQLGSLTVPGYAAFYSLILNLAVSAIATLVLNAMGAPRPADETRPADYHGGPETERTPLVAAEPVTE
jgi:SSS family solute:Na+ symporter